MEYARTDVVVVGAGPAGLTLSELLTRSGKNVTVVERQEDPTSAPQSVTLQPGTVDLLTKTEIPIPWENSTRKIRGVREYGPSGSVFARDYSELGPNVPDARMMAQADLRRTLLERLRTREEFFLRAGTEVAGIDSTEIENCSLELVDNSAGGRKTRIECDWLVAADGKYSGTRQLAGIDSRVSDFDHTMTMLPVATPPGSEVVLDMHRDPEGLVVAAREAAPGRTYVFVHTHDRTLSSADLIGHAADIVERADGELAREIRTGADPKRNVTLRPQTVEAESWRRNGALLLGDSAHGMHNLGAQGMNISLQNSVLLGSALCDYSVRAMDETENHRRPFVEKIQHSQHELGTDFWSPERSESWYEKRFEELALGQRSARPLWDSAIPAGAK